MSKDEISTTLFDPPRLPRLKPKGYDAIAHDCEFDPAEHLALEFPEQRISLHDLGYSQSEIDACSTDFAVASPAQLLSSAGAQACLSVARALQAHATGCERVENMVRGGIYRSDFLRGLCTDPTISEFLSDIYGVAVAPHSMPLQLGHLNYAPSDLSKAVDKWHHDTLELDYVLMVSDPRTLRGGEFQYFLGTKQRAEEYAKRGEALPDELVVSPQFADAGYFLPFHGHMLVHRGAKLVKPCERITMVNGYVSLNPGATDPNRFDELRLVDPDAVLLTEWARHKAWLSQNKLKHLMEQAPFDASADELIAMLQASIEDVQQSIEDLKRPAPDAMSHYGDGEVA